MRKLLWRIGFEIHWPWITTKLLLNEISSKMKVLLGFLWVHIQFPAEEQNRYSVVLKFSEPSCG